MDVQPEPVRPRDFLRKLEGHRQLPATVCQLHQDREREVAWPNAQLLHLGENLHATIVEALARAAIKERVVSLLIDADVFHGLHALDQFEGSVQLVQLAEALQHGAVGHNVGLDPVTDHLLQKAWGTPDLAATRASVDERVESHAGELRLEILRQHLLVERPDTIEAPLMRKTFEDGAVDHSVDRHLGFAVPQHLSQQGVRGIGLAVGHERFHCAAQRDARGQNSSSAHLLPRFAHALDTADKAEGTDDAAIGLRVQRMDSPPSTAVPVEQPCDKVPARSADARLQRRAQQDLIHVVAQVLQDCQGPVHICGL
mmetsp:Transcript_52488/g.145552  ORF Transcript_52488/g.145552 Transcript_52488/m.145552 type:complete len:313 (-) Transcript_52488:913-1851(-)